MTGLGMGGSAKPKARPGDMDRFMAWLEFMSVDKSTKSYAKEVHEATLAHDAAREEATTATAEANRRDAMAREAEDAARSQREALAAEVTITDTRLTAERDELAREQQRLEEMATELEAKSLDLTPREAALRRAFDAYQGE